MADTTHPIKLAETTFTPPSTPRRWGERLKANTQPNGFMQRRIPRHRAFTLLEILLAILILTFGITMLSEAIRQAHQNALSARFLTQAELIATSTLAEIRAGISPAQPLQQVPYEPDPSWLVSVDYQSTAYQGLVAVKVTVEQKADERQRPVTFSLVRWFPNTGGQTQEGTDTDSEDGDG